MKTMRMTLVLLFCLYLSAVNSWGDDVSETLIVQDNTGRMFVVMCERVCCNFSGSGYDYMYFLYNYNDHKFITRVDNGIIEDINGFLFFKGVLPSPRLEFKLEVLTRWDGNPYDS